MSYRLFVSDDRCTLVRIWATGVVEVCTREFDGAIWGPPIELAEEPVAA